MLDFRQDMIKLSQKYPFITTVMIGEDAWLELCNTFDRQVGLEEGHTANNIKEKSGLMQFETLEVRPIL
jgi:hypothetical protein